MNILIKKVKLKKLVKRNSSRSSGMKNQKLLDILKQENHLHTMNLLTLLLTFNQQCHFMQFIIDSWQRT